MKEFLNEIPLATPNRQYVAEILDDILTRFEARMLLYTEADGALNSGDVLTRERQFMLSLGQIQGALAAVHKLTNFPVQLMQALIKKATFLMHKVMDRKVMKGE